MAHIDRHDTDILIIGTGGAGLFAALHAQQSAPTGTRITIAVKGLIGKCGCTRMVQGGYNVAISGGDTVERHFMDTIQGGKWLPNQDMAWKLCEQAVVRIHELENEIGCYFDRNPDGSLHQKAFAGQTADRTVHKGDLTGIEIISRLMEQVLARPVEKLQEHRAIGLIPTRDGSALAGVLFIDMRTGGFRLVRAKTVLMATGGGPTMYKYNTPSGDKTMDGLAMSLRAGLDLRDMEMVQFHPTGLLAGDHTRMTGTVLEEGLRGAGGHLLNGAENRFMFDYDPRASAPRATWSAARSMPRSPRTTPPTMAACSSRWPISAPTMCARNSPAWSSAAPTAGSTLPGASSRWCRPRITSWAAWSWMPTPAPRWRGFMSPERTRAARMAPTVWAAMAWPIPPSMAGWRAT